MRVVTPRLCSHTCANRTNSRDCGISVLNYRHSWNKCVINTHLSHSRQQFNRHINQINGDNVITQTLETSVSAVRVTRKSVDVLGFQVASFHDDDRDSFGRRLVTQRQLQYAKFTLNKQLEYLLIQYILNQYICPPSANTHVGWSHLIWHNFITVHHSWR